MAVADTVCALALAFAEANVPPLTEQVTLSEPILPDAMTQLDNMHRVASLNVDVLAQLRTARSRILKATKALAARTADLQAALRAAAATHATAIRHLIRWMYAMPAP